MTQDINTQYDELLKQNLEKRLGRPSKPSELVNADNDSDLVNEILWELVCDLDKRIKTLEGK